MQDMFNEAIIARRIVLLSKMAASSDSDDRDVMLCWLCELAIELESRLDNVSFLASREYSSNTGSGFQ